MAKKKQKKAPKYNVNVGEVRLVTKPHYTLPAMEFAVGGSDEEAIEASNPMIEKTEQQNELLGNVLEMIEAKKAKQAASGQTNIRYGEPELIDERGRVVPQTPLSGAKQESEYASKLYGGQVWSRPDGKRYAVPYAGRFAGKPVKVGPEWRGESQEDWISLMHFLENDE